MANPSTDPKELSKRMNHGVTWLPVTGATYGLQGPFFRTTHTSTRRDSSLTSLSYFSDSSALASHRLCRSQ
jgi:hypothetical protein